MPADPPGSPAQRASDADRDRVIELLRVADGRLDLVEFDERLDAALAARTIDALAPLTADLIAVRGGNVELVLAPGMVVDANELSVRHSVLAISRDAGDDTPETLHVRLTGRIRHGRIDTRWPASCR